MKLIIIAGFTLLGLLLFLICVFKDIDYNNKSEGQFIDLTVDPKKRTVLVSKDSLPIAKDDIVALKIIKFDDSKTSKILRYSQSCEQYGTFESIKVQNI